MLFFYPKVVENTVALLTVEIVILKLSFRGFRVQRFVAFAAAFHLASSCWIKIMSDLFRASVVEDLGWRKLDLLWLTFFSSSLIGMSFAIASSRSRLLSIFCLAMTFISTILSIIIGSETPEPDDDIIIRFRGPAYWPVMWLSCGPFVLCASFVLSMVATIKCPYVIIAASTSSLGSLLAATAFRRLFTMGGWCNGSGPLDILNQLNELVQDDYRRIYAIAITCSVIFLIWAQMYLEKGLGDDQVVWGELARRRGRHQHLFERRLVQRANA